MVKAGSSGTQVADRVVHGIRTAFALGTERFGTRQVVVDVGDNRRLFLDRRGDLQDVVADIHQRV